MQQAVGQVGQVGGGEGEEDAAAVHVEVVLELERSCSAAPAAAASARARVAATAALAGVGPRGDRALRESDRERVGVRELQLIRRSRADVERDKLVLQVLQDAGR